MTSYHLTLLLTQACNLECTYCFTYDNKKTERIDKWNYLETTVIKIPEGQTASVGDTWDGQNVINL